SNGIGRLKRKNQIAVVNFVPSKGLLQSVLEHAEDLAIHVVLGDAEKQQRTDDPAKPSPERAEGSEPGRRAWRRVSARVGIGVVGRGGFLHQVAWRPVPVIYDRPGLLLQTP